MGNVLFPEKLNLVYVGRIKAWFHLVELRKVSKVEIYEKQMVSLKKSVFLHITTK